MKYEEIVHLGKNELEEFIENQYNRLRLLGVDDTYRVNISKESYVEINKNCWFNYAIKDDAVCYMPVHAHYVCVYVSSDTLRLNTVDSDDFVIRHYKAQIVIKDDAPQHINIKSKINDTVEMVMFTELDEKHDIDMSILGKEDATNICRIVSDDNLNNIVITDKVIIADRKYNLKRQHAIKIGQIIARDAITGFAWIMRPCTNIRISDNRQIRDILKRAITSITVEYERDYALRVGFGYEEYEIHNVYGIISDKEFLDIIYSY